MKNDIEEHSKESIGEQKVLCSVSKTPALFYILLIVNKSHDKTSSVSEITPY